MIYTLFILIPVSIVITGIFVLKGVQLGLRWQIEVKQEQKPTLENPIKPIIEHKQEKEIQKEIKEQATILDEWLNGESR